MKLLLSMVNASTRLLIWESSMKSICLPLAVLTWLFIPTLGVSQAPGSESNPSTNRRNGQWEYIADISTLTGEMLIAESDCDFRLRCFPERVPTDRYLNFSGIDSRADFGSTMLSVEMDVATLWSWGAGCFVDPTKGPDGLEALEADDLRPSTLALESPGDRFISASIVIRPNRAGPGGVAAVNLTYLSGGEIKIAGLGLHPKYVGVERRCF
jgi:hypothetical protein